MKPEEITEMKRSKIFEFDLDMLESWRDSSFDWIPTLPKDWKIREYSLESDRLRLKIYSSTFDKVGQAEVYPTAEIRWQRSSKDPRLLIEMKELIRKIDEAKALRMQHL